MVTLRELTAADSALINHWPRYPPGLEELDYALRQGGRLAEYHDRPDAPCFVEELHRSILAVQHRLSRVMTTEARINRIQTQAMHGPTGRVQRHRHAASDGA